MTIEGLSDIVRFPRAGIIRLGDRIKTDKPCKCEGKDKNHFLCKGTGKIYRTRELEHFVVPPLVQEVYGKKPKELDILFPVESNEVIFRQYYYSWGNGVLICRGDGKKGAFFDFDKGEWASRDCPCERLEARKCSANGILQFILPKVPEAGVFQITTTSRNSIIDINSGIAFVRSFTGGKIAFIPIILTRGEMRTTKYEKNGVIKGKHWTMRFKTEGVSPADLHELGTQPQYKALGMPDPIDVEAEDEEKTEAPDDVARDTKIILSNGSEKMLCRHEAYRYFERVRQELSITDYDLILSQAGYKHYSEITSEDMNTVFKLLLDRIDMRKKEKEKPEEIETDENGQGKVKE